MLSDMSRLKCTVSSCLSIIAGRPLIPSSLLALSRPTLLSPVPPRQRPFAGQLVARLGPPNPHPPGVLPYRWWFHLPLLSRSPTRLMAVASPDI